MAKKVTNPNDEILNAYVNEHDDINNGAPVTQDGMPAAPLRTQQSPENAGISEALNRKYMAARNEATEEQPAQNQQAARQHSLGRYQSMTDAGLKYNDNRGYMRIDLQSLPTGGLFYPDDTIIRIRAARGSEIKHWSTMNDQDINQISQVDDILNYIIEKCVNVDIPSKPGSSWKDLKDIDRFYLLLAIREFTFLEGDNELMVPISENKSVPVTKEMIDFIKIPDEIMKHYSPEEKCSVFHLAHKDIRMYIP